MRGFRIGDKVVCIENPKALAELKHLHPCYPGGGWVKDKVFVIKEINPYEGDTVYWPIGGGNGVWGNFLRLDSNFREGDTVAINNGKTLIKLCGDMRCEDKDAVLISRKRLI